MQCHVSWWIFTDVSKELSSLHKYWTQPQSLYSFSHNTDHFVHQLTLPGRWKEAACSSETSVNNYYTASHPTEQWPSFSLQRERQTTRTQWHPKCRAIKAHAVVSEARRESPQQFSPSLRPHVDIAGSKRAVRAATNGAQLWSQAFKQPIKEIHISRRSGHFGDLAAWHSPCPSVHEPAAAAKRIYMEDVSLKLTFPGIMNREIAFGCCLIVITTIFGGFLCHIYNLWTSRLLSKNINIKNFP
jgi:hypothetical protein